MDIEQIQVIREYVYWFMTIGLVIILYTYIFHLYRSEKKGEADYEKYAKMALEDELTDEPVEERIRERKSKKEESIKES